MESMSQDLSQVVIPEELKSILKEYTKNILRAQPTDLIQWSADYFRSLRDANNQILENEDEENNVQ